jgi:LuxR family maltose regulon positive regulatory protein
MSFGRGDNALVLVIRSKLSPPSQAVSILDRPRLRPLLEEPAAAMVLVVAPAGFGKTTLLAQHYAGLKQADRAVAWLSVDEDDNDPARFLAHLVHSIVLAMPEISSLGEATAQGMLGLSVKTALWSLIEAVQDNDPFTLIVDDIHRVQNRAVLELLQTFIDAVPGRVSVIIAGRGRPTLRLSAMRAQGLLQEIDLDALRFTEAEAQCYFGKTVDPADIRQLVSRTEGWAVALQLSRLWLRERGHLPVHEHQPTTTALGQYLSEEILNLLPDEQRFFLMATSIVQEINGELANILTDRTDGWSMLDEMEQQNLLITAVDPQHRWYRYHNVFADFLRDRLHRLHGAAVTDLHRRAATWFVQNGMPQEAVRHALRTGEPAYAAQLVDDMGGWWLGLKGGMSMLRALGEIDVKVMERYPRTRLGQIYLTAQDGNIGQARADFEALRLSTQDFHLGPEADWDRSLFAESRAVELILSIYEDRPISTGEMEALNRFVEGEGGSSDSVVRGLIGNFICYGYFDAGNYLDCRKLGYQTLQRLDVQQTPYAENYLHAYMAMACLRQGHIEEAGALLRTMRQKASVLFGQGSNQVAIAELLLAEVELNSGNVNVARKLIEDALPIVERVDGWFDVYASGYLTAAAVTELQEGADAAIAVMERAASTAVRRGLARLEALVAVHTARILTREARFSDAERMLEHACLDSCRYVSPDISARELFLTGHCLGARARLLIGKSKPTAALALLTPLRKVLIENEQVGLLVDILLLEAAAELHSGNTVSATGLMADMLDYSSRTGVTLPLLSEPALLREMSGRLKRHLAEPHQRQLFCLALASDPVPPGASEAPVLSGLTHREGDVAVGLADGLSNKEIARRLGVAEGTVKIHRKNIYRKLNIHNRASVVSLLREQPGR